MMHFKVEGMSCQHCVNAVNKAIQSGIPGAVVKVDLASGVVTVDNADNPELIRRLITEAGYQVVAG
ncbi:MAG: heavy-metal-associated domain-containing protein [Pigmentiphaga sp.]